MIQEPSSLIYWNQFAGMKLRSVLSLASTSLVAALLIVSLASYEHAKRRLDWLTEVAGRNVLLIRIGEGGGNLAPLGSDFLAFISNLEGLVRVASQVQGGRRPNVFDYYTLYVSENYFQVRGFRFAA